MSRIGKKPVELPSKVEVSITAKEVKVKGPKGSLQLSVPAGISVEKKDSQLVVLRADDSLAAKHGLIRSLLANCVSGVDKGFQKDLEIVGIGFRAELKGRFILLNLGFSHPVEFPLPEGIQVAIEKQTKLAIIGFDKHMVGQVAADIRALKKPDPYKNKGIRYVGEVLEKKAGKAGSK